MVSSERRELRYHTSDNKFGLHKVVGESHQASESTRHYLNSMKTKTHVAVKELHVPIVFLEITKILKNAAHLNLMSGRFISEVNVGKDNIFKLLRTRAHLFQKSLKLFTAPELNLCQFYCLVKQWSAHMLLQKVLRAKRRFLQP